MALARFAEVKLAVGLEGGRVYGLGGVRVGIMAFGVLLFVEFAAVLQPFTVDCFEAVWPFSGVRPRYRSRWIASV